MLRWFLVACGLLGAAVVAVYVLNPLGTATLDPRARVLGFTVLKVSSNAMAPTLQPGDFLWIDTLALRHGVPPRGAVVVLRYPADPGAMIVSRVVGLGGDTVSILDGVVHVDGRAIAEPYLAGQPLVQPYSQALGENRVPPDHVFVLGDHRDNAHDSRFWGPVHRRELVGVVSSGAAGEPAPR